MTTPARVLAIGVLTAGLAITACSGGEDGSATTAPVTSDQPDGSPADSAPTTSSAPTTPPSSSSTSTSTTTTVEVYDEASRIPLADLPSRLGETIERQGGDPEVSACVLDKILAAYDSGELSPFDLDAYARLSTVTPAITELLQELQNSNDCAKSGS